MNRYALSHLSRSALRHGVRSLTAQDRATTALLVAHLGEFDARRLYAEVGYPSMFAWCVAELHLPEDTAYKRIRVARTARQFPFLYELLADGRLHLSAVVMLTPYLTSENAAELSAAAVHKSKAQIEQLLAERFPQPDVPTLIAPVTAPACPTQLAPGPVKLRPTEHAAVAPTPQKVAPLAPQRFAVQFTMDQATRDDLAYAQALLGHVVPTGDVAQVFARALKALISKLERDKFARTDRPRPCRRSDDARQIPAEVKREVWERDGGQCTFVGENGHRCESRTRLEFDHVEPVAQGGHATVKGLRLRCRAHNQYEAEQRFGRDFMETKRETRGKPPLPERAAEVVPYLERLGMRTGEARYYAGLCADMPEASLEDRLRHALRCSAKASPKRVAQPATAVASLAPAPDHPLRG